MINKKKVTTKERVASELRRAIYFGSFKAGQELIQDTIANQLGVSRMPVRDAIAQLYAEGLVEHIPNRGYFVKNISRDFFKDYYFTRNIFELRAIDYLCDTWTNLSELEALAQQETQLYERHDLQALSHCSDMIHEYFFNHCGSPRLAAYLRQMRNMAPRRISNTSEEQAVYIQINYRYHQNLINAIKKRDKDLVHSLVSGHRQIAQDYYFKIRDELHLDN